MAFKSATQQAKEYQSSYEDRVYCREKVQAGDFSPGEAVVFLMERKWNQEKAERLVQAWLKEKQ